MKFILAIALLCSTAHAAVAPREELKTLTAQLAKSPSDDALREKIIKLAVGLKPAPAITKEARRRMVRGGTAMKEAASPADYRAAASEFEKATLEAPWWGDAYYNLAIARNKAEDFAGALAALKLVRLASPGNQDAEDLASAVEFRMEKANSPEVRAAKQKVKDDELMKSLEGAVFYEVDSRLAEGQYRISSGAAQSWSRRLESGVCICSDTSRCNGPVGEEGRCTAVLRFEGRHGEMRWPDGAREILDVSEDGKSAVMKMHSEVVGWLTEKTYKRR